MVKFLLYASLTKRPMQVARDQLGKHGMEGGGGLQQRLHAVATAGSGEGQYGVLLLASPGFKLGAQGSSSSPLTADR